MKKIIITESQFKTILKEATENYNKFPLSALTKMAQKFQNFKDFSHLYSIDIYHGYYWHWTDNPNFQLSQDIGPRDMSSMSSGTEGLNKGSLMITSDIQNWDIHYNQYKKGNIVRPYAVLFDASDIEPKYLKQVSRGFGNELFLFPPQAKQLKQIGIYKRDTAKAIDRKFHNIVPQSEKELYKLWKFTNQQNETPSET